MGLLSGRHNVTIDAKNRLMIPVEFRREVDRMEGCGRWSVVLHTKNRLLLMPVENFERWRQELGYDLFASDEEGDYSRFLDARSQPVTPDKQGRVVLPEDLLGLSGLSRDVTLVGQGDRVEVYERARLQEQVRSADYDALYEKARAAAAARRARNEGSLPTEKS